MRGERGKRITDEVYVCVRVVFYFGKSPTLEFSHHNFNGSDGKMPKRKTNYELPSSWEVPLSSTTTQ